MEILFYKHHLDDVCFFLLVFQFLKLFRKKIHYKYNIACSVTLCMSLASGMVKLLDSTSHPLVLFFSLAVNFKEVNEENKRELFSEVFSSIEALAFTFGNV